MMGDAAASGHSEDSDYEVGKHFDLSLEHQARTYQDCMRCSEVAPCPVQVVTKEKIDAAEKVINAHMGLGEMKHFNREGCAPAWTAHAVRQAARALHLLLHPMQVGVHSGAPRRQATGDHQGRA